MYSDEALYCTSYLNANGFLDEPHLSELRSLVKNGLPFVFAMNKVLYGCEYHVNELALRMIELYPKGMKDGTSLPWRGNYKEVKDRLQLFRKSYGHGWSDDEVVEATRSYISSFTDSTYMRTLKNFIFRYDINGMSESLLASVLENGVENNKLNEWNIDL